jgi:hypothetical protein
MHAARFVLINIAAGALLFVAAVRGWVALIVENDPSRITLVIAALLAVGLGLCAWRFVTLRRVPQHESLYADKLAAWIDERIKTVRLLVELLPLLGLIGTVVGFVIAFLGFDLGALASADQAATVVGAVLRGVGVALYTTLVGALAGAWLHLCYRTLESHATDLWLSAR